MLFNVANDAFIVPTDEVPLLEYKFPMVVDKSTGRELLDYGKGHSNGKLYFGRGLKLNGVDQSFTVNTQGATRLYYFFNGELQEIDVTSIDSKEFTAEGVYQNAISTSKQFTVGQIEYLKSHPEKFLYSLAETQTDGSKTYSLHSEILTQEEIDSVVAYLPMCEADGYVRDMVMYSEILDFNEEFTGTLGNFYSVSGGVLENLDGDKLKVTSDGSSDFSRAVVDLVGYEIGDKILVSFDVVSITGSVRFHDYSNNKSYTDLLAQSTYKVVITLGDFDTNLGFGGYSDSEFELIIDNVKVSKLTSTNQITNFTNSCRDEALHLTYGLQTCFLQRDSLGVPSGSSFDRLQCDGVGYVDSGWIPKIGEYFILEAIVYQKNDTHFELNGNSFTKGVYFGTHATDNVIYMRLFDTDGNFTTTYEGFHHICIENLPSSGEVAFYINGNMKSKVSRVGSTETAGSVFLGNVYGFSYPYRQLIELFKVHTTPQNPVELYNEAVRKGLLDA